MDTKRLFDSTINIAEKALNLRARRHELILSNIANADTPNYKAFDLLVDEALAKQSGSNEQVSLKKTNPSHFPINRLAEEEIQPQRMNISTQATLRGDGNTVDMDREMSTLAANQLQYKASAQILAKKFQALRSVIQGGKG